MERKQQAPPRRAILFFPANQPERFEKAVATGVDCVCIDLEDAVAPDRKAEGRSSAVELLNNIRLPKAEVIVRLNDTRTADGLADIEALASATVFPDAVMLPKVDSAEEVLTTERRLRDALPGADIIVLIETARGLEFAWDIAQSSRRISALVLGGVDLSGELGCAIDWHALLYARSRVVHAAVGAGIDAIDMPCLNVADTEALETEARAVARLGFTGKAVLHPSQVHIVQAAFAPDEAEIARARNIIAAYERAAGAPVLVDGQIVERPVLRAAQRTIALRAQLEARRSTGRRAQP